MAVELSWTQREESSITNLISIPFHTRSRDICKAQGSFESFGVTQDDCVTGKDALDHSLSESHDEMCQSDIDGKAVMMNQRYATL